jgi:hypothetical protein
VGGLAAFCSYYLFSVFILSNYLRRQALVSFLLGMASFVIIEMYKSSLMINNLIFTWQLLVGSGLIYFGIKNRKKLQLKNTTLLTVILKEQTKIKLKFRI